MTTFLEAMEGGLVRADRPRTARPGSRHGDKLAAAIRKARNNPWTEHVVSAEDAAEIVRSRAAEALRVAQQARAFNARRDAAEAAEDAEHLAAAVKREGYYPTEIEEAARRARIVVRCWLPYGVSAPAAQIIGELRGNLERLAGGWTAFETIGGWRGTTETGLMYEVSCETEETAADLRARFANAGRWLGEEWTHITQHIEDAYHVRTGPSKAAPTVQEYLAQWVRNGRYDGPEL